MTPEGSEFHNSTMLVCHDVGEGVIGALVAGTAEIIIGIVRAKAALVESKHTLCVDIRVNDRVSAGMF